MQKQIMLIPMTPNTNFAASFGHLAGMGGDGSECMQNGDGNGDGDGGDVGWGQLSLCGIYFCLTCAAIVSVFHRRV